MTGGVRDTLLRRADILPAHLFGPGHGSLTYGVEIDGAVGRAHGYKDQVITDEINRQVRLKQRQAMTRSQAPYCFVDAASFSHRYGLLGVQLDTARETQSYSTLFDFPLQYWCTHK